jgi:hypothetical protein
MSFYVLRPYQCCDSTFPEGFLRAPKKEIQHLEPDLVRKNGWGWQQSNIPFVRKASSSEVKYSPKALTTLRTDVAPLAIPALSLSCLLSWIAGGSRYRIQYFQRLDLSQMPSRCAQRALYLPLCAVCAEVPEVEELKEWPSRKLRGTEARNSSAACLAPIGDQLQGVLGLCANAVTLICRSIWASKSTRSNVIGGNMTSQHQREDSIATNFSSGNWDAHWDDYECVRSVRLYMPSIDS